MAKCACSAHTLQQRSHSPSMRKVTTMCNVQKSPLCFWWLLVLLGRYSLANVCVCACVCVHVYICMHSLGGVKAKHTRRHL